MSDVVFRPVPVSIDRIRAGQVVLVDGRRHYVVTRFRMSEEARSTEKGPEAAGSISVEVELQPAYWLDPLFRVPDAPPPPESPALLVTEEVRSGRPFVIDGCAYGVEMSSWEVTEPGHRRRGAGSSLADFDLITLRLCRVWWNDPQGPVQGAGQEETS